MKKISEKVLTDLKLKYYQRSGVNAEGVKSGITCAWCFEPDIVNIGGGYKDEEGNAKQICEKCAVWRYKDDFGFKTLTAARARRRRIFDVGYLFNELILDIYMNTHNILDFAHFDKADELFVRSSSLYNFLFAKEDKIRLEEMEDQDSIVHELQNRLSDINLRKLFMNL